MKNVSRRTEKSQRVGAREPQPRALEQLWQSIVAEVDGVFAPSFTLKERGQLKQFARRCIPGQAEPILEHTLRHWLIFIATAKAHVGLYKVPAEPHVGFLLKHVGLASNLWLKHVAKPKFVPTPPAPPPAKQPKAPVAEPECAPLPTWEEAHAFFYPPPKYPPPKAQGDA